MHIPNMSLLLKCKQEQQTKIKENHTVESILPAVLQSQATVLKEKRGRKPKITFDAFMRLYLFYWSVGNSFSFEDGQSPSAKDFCRQYGIPERTYFHYKKKLA